MGNIVGSFRQEKPKERMPKGYVNNRLKTIRKQKGPGNYDTLTEIEIIYREFLTSD
jgi:hypothetical protein